MRILGIDPGLATMGWGVIEADGYREKLVQYGALITYPRDTFPTRLRCIYTGVRGLLETFKPDEIAFEELFFSKNVTTGIQVGGARGVALVACQAYTDKLFEYTPMQIKQAVVGYGGADKHQVQMMVRMLLGISNKPIPMDMNTIITKGLTLQGIYGRRMDNWHQMSYMVQGGLDLTPAITHRFHYTEFEKGFEAMHSGMSGKVILDWTTKKEDEAE